MTAQLLLLLLLAAAFVVVALALRQERRWRLATVRAPLPVSRVVGRVAALVDLAVATDPLRGARRGAVGRGDQGAGYADVHAADVDAVVAGRPRTVRPARLVVTGDDRRVRAQATPVTTRSWPTLTGVAALGAMAIERATRAGQALPGMTRATRAEPAEPDVPREARVEPRIARADPRGRLLRDTVGVVALGAAILLALSLAPRSPALESAVLGATATPETRTPLPAIVAGPPSPAGGAAAVVSASPTAGEESPDASVGLDADASPSPTVAAVPTPGPTSTPRRATPAPHATATPEPSAAATAGASPSVDPSSGPSPSPEASQSGEPTPTTAPTPSVEPSVEPSVAPSPEPTPTPEPSPSTAPSSEPATSPDATASPTPTPT